MAFKLVQEFKFEKLDYNYDRLRDVLEISFGPPAPAIAVQVEDWLALQLRINPPALQGITIVGFRKIFEKINRYAERELPDRMNRLARVKMFISYDDGSDTLVYRWEEGQLSLPRELRPTIFEPFSKGRGDASLATAAEQSLHNVYLEKALPSKEIVGLKILEFTKCGPAALEGILGAIIDTIFESNAEYDENIQLITDELVQHFDLQKLAELTA
jgi:hypothetical protein